MRNFADVVRLPAPNRKPVELQNLVQKTAELMEWKAEGKQLHFEFEFHSKPYSIFADPLQMEQALINIVKNAVESISEKGIVRFIIKKNPMQLIIEDNGRPIPGDIADQLFSPFFSTKKDGQGIGLTLTREILVNHGFDFSLRTREDGLTAFTINFS